MSKPTFDMLESVETTAARVALILVWYFSDEEHYEWPDDIEDDEQMMRRHFSTTLATLVSLSPQIANKSKSPKVKKYAFDIYDALGSFPERTEDLDEVYEFYRENQ